MKKNERITAYLEQLPGGPDLLPALPGGLDWHYQGYFTCFNAGDYYEAHDVLEHLWLRVKGPEFLFYKGLIQVAGAFVHLRKHHLRPWHPKDGARLRPAVRLFALAERNLESYGEEFLQLRVDSVRALCRYWTAEITASDFTRNPWTPERKPHLALLPSP